MARSGALLVTGHRGVGKSRFVDFCLREFEQDVYKRYLRSTIGRVLFWDLFLIVFLILIALAVPLIASGVLELVFAQRPPPDRAIRSVFWDALITAPILLLCAFPWVYAWETTLAACDVLPKAGSPRVPRSEAGGASWRLFAVCLGASLLALLFGPFGEPVVGAAYLVCMAAWLYAAVRALSVCRESWPLKIPPGYSAFSDFNHLNWGAKWLLPGAVLGGAAIMALPSRQSPLELGFVSLVFTVPHDSMLLLAWHYLLGSLPFFCVGLALRARDAQRLARFLDKSQKQDEGLPRAHADRISRAHKRSREYTLLAAMCLLLGAIAAYNPEPRPIHFASALAVLLYVLAFVQRRVLTKGSSGQDSAVVRLVPRGRYVIALKAMFCFMLAIQLLTPCFSWVSSTVRREAPPSSDLQPIIDLLPKRSLLSKQLEPFGERELFDDRGLRAGTSLGVWKTFSDELLWLLIAGFFLIQVVSMEYSWIVRRLERERLDSAHNPDRRDMVEDRAQRGGESAASEAGPARSSPTTNRTPVSNARELASATLFWLLYQTWMPVLIVRVNLGFDAPSHTRVVEAMLVGLRESYHRVFITWRSRIGTGMLVAQLSVAVLATFVVSEQLARDDHGRRKLGAADIELYDVLDHRPESQHRAFAYLLPYEFRPDNQLPHIVLYAHHLLLLVVFFVCLRIALGRSGLYGSIDRGLNELLHRLSSTVKISTPPARSSFKLGDFQVSAQGEGREVSTAPQDPRAVEHAFHQVLQRIVVPYLELPVRTHLLSLPAPEVVFVFDELDKIGSRTMLAPAGTPELTLEGTRTQQLHALFADMKNLLSTAPARFIFVGGRNLHDEWLADQTLLRPLLSSIFDIEVYLPTLLSDPIPVGSNDREPSRGTEAFLNAQLARVSHLHTRWERDKRIFGRVSPPQSPALLFVQQPRTESETDVGKEAPKQTASIEPSLAPNAATTEHTLKTLPILRTGLLPARKPRWAPELIGCWIHYMAFRSRGIPRALHELLEGFVRPIGRIVDVESDRATYFDCQHVVYFGDVDRYRVQFVASLYRQLCGRPTEQRLSRNTYAEQLVRRRDETAQTAFYLADVLFKFHSRAFSWSNLERIDELAHVHAPAGIRDLLESVVRAFSETHITPTTSGIYDFRFRSEAEAEIRYVSRHSPKEMAALNFTLDESQALRQHYLQRLAASDPGSSARFELEAGVGELYDFDERYEHARGHYERAIQALDERLKSVHGPGTQLGILAHVFDGAAGRSINRRYVQWGVSRLRLMLQIGMTYERTRNFELAVVQYRDARTLSRAIWMGMLDDPGRGETGAGAVGRHRLETLKLLPIVYQALFASAWLTEKAAASSGAATSLLERGLWDLRTRLPSVRDANLPKRPSTRLQHHPSFFISISDLHQSTAQVYFFKGHDCRVGRGKQDGQLLMAQYHYLVALHELRRAVSTGVDTPRTPLLAQAERHDSSWSDAVVLRAAATLFELAETWMARVRLSNIGAPTSKRPVSLKSFEKWLRTGKSNVTWLGRWNDATITQPQPRSPNPPERASAKRPNYNPSEDPFSGEWRGLVDIQNPSIDQLVNAFSEATELGVSLLERANHHCEAARESIRCAAALENLLTCLRAETWLRYEARTHTSHVRALHPEDPRPLQLHLLQQAVDALERADELLLEKTGRPATFGEDDIERIFPHARTLAATLGLHAVALSPAEDAQWKSVIDRIGALVRRWKSYRDQDLSKITTGRTLFRRALCDALSWQVYPMLNRLGALRALIVDAALLGAPAEEQKQCDAHVMELVRQDAVYASAWHFTPFHGGVAVGLWAARQLLDSKGDEFAAYALRSLRASVSMSSGGTVYVNQLTELYYLDGDFSDRCIHSRHSQQLLGTELSLQLIEHLERPLAKQDSDADRPERSATR
ncbi:MAG TPA: hypothetical protein VJV78_08465 [Polyangiales bacterium]|nr:hypothetical protein [Polyangiales bacterium]